jgi:hypothetical protein
MLTELDSRLPASIIVLCLTAGATWSEATVITFDVAAVAGNTFEYTYVVENDTLSVDIEELAVYFDVDLFENLRLATTPPDWDPVVVQPDALLRDDGFLDVLALLGGIPPGGSLGRFTVQADFLGTGVPSRQRFEILDPVTLAVLDSGFTVPATTVPVPEPGLLWLFGVVLYALRHRRGARSPEAVR